MFGLRLQMVWQMVLLCVLLEPPDLLQLLQLHRQLLSLRPCRLVLVLVLTLMALMAVLVFAMVLAVVDVTRERRAVVDATRERRNILVLLLTRLPRCWRRCVSAAPAVVVAGPPAT